jgi:hypothetical protein
MNMVWDFYLPITAVNIPRSTRIKKQRRSHIPTINITQIMAVFLSTKTLHFYLNTVAPLKEKAINSIILELYLQVFQKLMDLRS